MRIQYIKENFVDNVVENFVQPMTYKVDKVYETPNIGFVSVPGTYQSAPPARFGMLDGAIVNNNLNTANLSSHESFRTQNNAEDSMAFNPSSPLQQGIMDVNGEMIQPVVYDRLIYANKRSRLTENADFIRGDLPIFPNNLGWFSPSVQPHIVLRHGIIDDYDKETSDRLKLLQMESQGKYDHAFQGEMVPPNTNISNYGTFINPPIGDVEVINFV